MAQESFEQLLNAVKQAESRGQRFDEKGNLLTSPKGAQGEMQVMPKTARSPGYGVAPAQDKTPDELARVGKDYLQAMLNKYGDTKTALMAYNWGPKNTDDWLAAGADPKKVPAETQKYTRDILNSLSGTKTGAPASAEPTASEKMMTDALKSGMSAQNLIKDAGPGYKAAMAMMFLAEDKPKSEEDDIWKEAEPEQTAEMDTEEPASPLASLDLSYKSPFPAQKVQPVARLAGGGLPGAPKVGVKGTAREELDKVKADYDRYAKEADTYNTALNQYKSDIYDPYTKEVDKYNAGLEEYKTKTYNPYVKAVEDYNASLDKYKQELYSPYVAAVDKYNADLERYNTETYNPYLQKVADYNSALQKYQTDIYDPYSKALDEYNAAAEAWNAGPRTTAFDKTAPTLAKTFDMAAPAAPVAFSGTAPTAPEAFAGTAPTAPAAFSMAAPTLAKTFDRTAPVMPTVTQADYDKMVAASRQDVVNRQQALDVASNPEAYGLTINKLFAEGGEAKSSADDLAALMPNIEDTSPAPFHTIKGANKQMIGNRELENMMMGLGTDSTTLGVNLSKMKQDDKENLAQSLMAAYRKQMGDVNLNVNMIRPVDAPPGVYMGALNAGIPVGNRDQLLVGASGMRTPDESRITGYNLGYSGEVGPGRLNAMMMQPKGNPQGRNYQIQYQIPLKADGGVVHRADGSSQEGEMSQSIYPESGMKTEYSNAPKRTAKEMLVYMQAQNPSVRIDKFPMDSNTMGYVSSRQPDIVNINPDQSPAREELTKLHELEHSLALRSGDILGRPEIRGQDNAYRAYHLLKKDWTPIRQFAYNMASNKDKLEKFFGQPMDSGYLNMSKQTLDDIRNRGDALQGLAEEQMASLSALEQTTGKFLTQDPEMRKLFPSTKMMAVYDALTGPRQTRMDARDLPAHTPVPSYMYQDNPVLKFIQKHTTGANEYGIPIKRAAGSPEEGEVKEPWLPQVSSYSELTAQDMYPGQQGQFDQRDAARHMLAAGTLARKYGPGTAELLGKAHEITTSPLRYIGSKLGISQMPVDYEQDLHNNKIGIELAARSKSQKDLENLVMQMAEQHRLQQTEGKPWTGKPVRRGDGSPQTGEIGPAFGNPNIQRQGAKARALAAQRDVNTLPDPKTYAAVSGFLGTPFQEQGWSVFHPQRQGIETAADVGYTAGLGAQIAPVAAPVLKGAAKLVGSGLNERMLAGQSLTPGINTPAPVNFAVRPEGGGFFLHNQRQGIDDVDAFLRHYVGVQKESTNPLDQWMYKRYSSYMRGTMGTEMDPFVKAADQGKKLHFLDQQGTPFQPAYVDHLPYIRERMGLPKHGFATTPTGTRVEEAIDATINPMAVGEVGDLNLSPKMKELQARNPDQPVYELMHEEVRDVLKPEDLKIALSDMMRSTDLPAEYRLTQDQLNKMTLLDASEKVAQFNQYLDAKKSTQLLREAKDVPVYKAYKEDDGHRWMAPEDVMNDESSRRYVMTAGKDANWCTKSEDTCMAYGADPYRLLILSDERGKPLAQVQYENYVPDVNDWMHTLPPSTERQLRDDYMIHQIENLPEYKQWAQQNTQMNIREIKGRHNETNLQGPVLDKVRDLIRSGNWSMVDDLKNAQLVDATSLAAGRYVDMNAYEKAVKDRFGTLYLTPEEAVEAKSMVQTAPKPPEEYAKGGSVERVSGDNRRYL